ncbi:POK18 protein, partial [Upupa epops]|nr:POK18 protein [Upupa epops]
MQKLSRSINWVCPYLGHTTIRLAPLFNLLSPRQLTPDADKASTLVEEAVYAHQVHRVEKDVMISLCIAIHDNHPVGIIGQWNVQCKDPLHLL